MAAAAQPMFGQSRSAAASERNENDVQEILSPRVEWNLKFSETRLLDFTQLVYLFVPYFSDVHVMASRLIICHLGCPGVSL